MKTKHIFSLLGIASAISVVGAFTIGYTASKNKDSSSERQKTASFWTNYAFGSAYYVNTRIQMAKVFVYAKDNQLEDEAILSAFRKIDWTEMKDQCRQSVELFEKSDKDFFSISDKFGERFKTDYLRLGRLVNNHYEFINELSRGQMTSHSVSKWLDESHEAKDLMEIIGEEFIKD
jgi:hypothetical protein